MGAIYHIPYILYMAWSKILHLFPPDIDLFIFSILVIAIITWILRTLVESDPDPFLLNITFFAFVGQAIRTGELAHEGNVRGTIIFLMLVALGLVLIQVMVLRAQKTATLEHYKALLDQYKTNSCLDDQIDHWANALLQISGIDFDPKYSSRLEVVVIIFTAEARAKSRREAFSILPSSHFRVTEFDAEHLLVPQDRRRKLWRWYLGTCFFSWVCFVGTMIMSTKK